MVETAKMHGFNTAMTMEWLQDFGLVQHQFRTVNATLTHEVNNRGLVLDNKLMGFTPESVEGFDVDSWLPWNYLALRGRES